MRLTVRLLHQFGATRDEKRGGLVIEALRFRAVFLADPRTDGVWNVRVTPKPERSGARAFVVATTDDLFHALFYAGLATGGEDIRHKFRMLMDVAEGVIDSPTDPDVP